MMINIFDLSAGITGTKMMKDKINRDGSPTQRGRPDETVKKVVDPVGVLLIDDKQQVTHESRNSSRNKCSGGGTPMKKLIEQEMSKEMEAPKNPPSIVAKLMGLEALPAQKLAQPLKDRSTQEGKIFRVNSNSSSSASRDNRLQKNVYGGRNLINTSGTVTRSIHSQSTEHREYKDVYEVPPRTYRMKDENLMHERLATREKSMDPHGRFSPGEKRTGLHGRFSPSEKRMDLVREKFNEAKRLAANHKLLHSKEFQDAIEVLSSNRDLFLKFLEEPNSLFSEYIRELHMGTPLPSQTRRITVLKPSNQPPDDTAVDEILRSYIPVQERGKPSTNPGFIHPKNKPLPQPTRIVVLRPSPAKSLNGKMPVSSPPTSPMLVEVESFEEPRPCSDRYTGLAEKATITTPHLRDSYCHRRDETLLSSVLSNGYTGDESSFNRSDCEYMEDDEIDNSSDSGILSPIARHSWDCNNRFDSPCSLSSFSRASYSPESSVIREAKKRLSERWVMVTTNEHTLEQKQVQRSVSTLGEMLAIRGANKEGALCGVVSSRSGSYSREHELSTASSTSMPAADKNKDMNGEVNSFPTLQRSKSVPASSSAALENITGQELEGRTDSHVTGSSSKDRVKGGKSISFKVKVSNFFSRNKKSGPDRNPGSQSSNGDSSGRSSPQLSLSNLNEGSVQTPVGSPSLTPCRSFNQDAQIFGSSAEVSLILKTSEKANEPSAEPSPDSVLEASFQDDAKCSSSHIYQGTDMGSSRAISRSPPIESIARSLPIDGGGTRSERIAATNPPPPRHSLTSFLKADSEEHERDLLVRKLLSAAGMSEETTSTVLSRWHSLDSPLNPSLLDQFLERKGEEAQCRVRRSNQRLLFDSVNAALLGISWDIAIKECVRSWSAHWQRVVRVPGLDAPPPCAASLTEEVLGRLNEWFLDGQEGWSAATGYEQDTTQAVDGVVRKEVCGAGWLDMGAMEVLELCKEMEEQVLRGLVTEALVDFIEFSAQVQ